MALADGFIFQVSPDGRLIDTAETASTLRSFTGEEDAQNGPLPDRLFLFAAPQSRGDDAPLWELEAIQTLGAGNAGVVDAATVAEERRYMDFTLPSLRP